MRAYHLTSADHALSNLQHRRLKIATFNDLNDPFELWAVAQPNPTLRSGLRRWKDTMARTYGVLCFSEDWHNPVLWSHYADKHRGIALGFDINPNILENVRYQRTRPTLRTLDKKTTNMLLYTKYKDWAYEQEWRIYTRLNDRDPKTGFYFAAFGTNLVLRDIITGPLCTINKSTIQDALRDKHVTITKGRLAFNTFQIVKNQRGFRAANPITL